MTTHPWCSANEAERVSRPSGLCGKRRLGNRSRETGEPASSSRPGAGLPQAARAREGPHRGRRPSSVKSRAAFLASPRVCVLPCSAGWSRREPSYTFWAGTQQKGNALFFSVRPVGRGLTSGCPGVGSRSQVQAGVPGSLPGAALLPRVAWTRNVASVAGECAHAVSTDGPLHGLHGLGLNPSHDGCQKAIFWLIP